jgi:hypothetical protein
MVNLSLNKNGRLAGIGYIALNILRGLNIISLLTVVVGSWIMLVRTVQTSNVKPAQRFRRLSWLTFE